MRTRSGLSLTELLLVLLVAAVALVPIYELLTGNARQVSFNADHAIAQILATQVLERYRYEKYEALAVGFATWQAGAQAIATDVVLNELTIGIPEQFQPVYYQRFKRAAQFTEIIPGHLGELQCTVEWTSNQRQPCSFLWTTLVRNSEYHHGKL